MGRKPKSKPHVVKDTRKKTGKRLPYPADPEDPKDNPEKQIETLTTVVTKQQATGSLVADNPPKPKVVGDRFEAFYLKPHFAKSPKGDLSVALAFSVALEKEHKELLPKIVAEAYHDVLKKGRKSMTLNGIPGQRVSVYLSHDSKGEILFLAAAKLTSASLALVERKGEGAARKVIRFSFRLQVPLPAGSKTDDVSYFAERNLQNSFWIKLEEADPALFEEDEKEKE
jgi:hypothetical protein